jgi:hypothetical protein
MRIMVYSNALKVSSFGYAYLFSSDLLLLLLPHELNEEHGVLKGSGLGQGRLRCRYVDYNLIKASSIFTSSKSHID